MINKIVVRFADGITIKGTTGDFSPNKNMFHIQDKNTNEVIQVFVKDLKAVFFVKDFKGDPTHNENVDIERAGLGKKILIDFKDGEQLVGYTQGFSRDRAGFILFPCDPDSNNEKALIVTTATSNISFL